MVAVINECNSGASTVESRAHHERSKDEHGSRWSHPKINGSVSITKFLKCPINIGKVIIKGKELTEELDMVWKFLVCMNFKKTTSLVTGWERHLHG